MLRLLLVPVFFLFMYYYLIGTTAMLWYARIVFAVIMITDFLDGYLARRWQEITSLGSILDPVADKLFVTASFVLLAAFDKVSAWLTIIVVAKDIFVSIGWWLMVILYDKIEVNPSLLGKVATALQFFTVFTVVMFPQGFHSILLEFITAAATIAAIIHYGSMAAKLSSGLNGTK
jgi:cardiolipin synthase